MESQNRSYLGDNHLDGSDDEEELAADLVDKDDGHDGGQDIDCTKKEKPSNVKAGKGDQNDGQQNSCRKKEKPQCNQPAGH